MNYESDLCFTCLIVELEVISVSYLMMTLEIDDMT